MQMSYYLSWKSLLAGILAIVLGSSTPAAWAELINNTSSTTARKPQPGINIISVGNRYADSVFSAAQVGAYMRMLADCGIKRVSIRVTWSKVEPSEGSYDQEVIGNLSRVASAAGDAGMAVMLDFHTKFQVANHARPNWIVHLPVDEGQTAVDSIIMIARSQRAAMCYVAMVRHVVGQLKDVKAIDVVSVMNEPYAWWDRGRDGVAPELARLTDVLCVAAQEARKANGNIRLAVRFTSSGNPWADEPIKRFDKALIMDHFDIIGLNIYLDPHSDYDHGMPNSKKGQGGNWAIYDRALAETRSAGKAFWVTEFGMQNQNTDALGKPYSVERQAQYYDDICNVWWNTMRKPDCVMPWVLEPDPRGKSEMDIRDDIEQRWFSAGELFLRFARLTGGQLR